MINENRLNFIYFDYMKAFGVFLIAEIRGENGLKMLFSIVC